MEAFGWMERYLPAAMAKLAHAEFFYKYLLAYTSCIIINLIISDRSYPPSENIHYYFIEIQ